LNNAINDSLLWDEQAILDLEKELDEDIAAIDVPLNMMGLMPVNNLASTHGQLGSLLRDAKNDLKASNDNNYLEVIDENDDGNDQLNKTR